MKLGVAREIKDNENRVALVPSGVETLTRHGHTVFVEAGAGLGTGIKDSEYVDAGGTVVNSARDVWDNAELVCKVKEPLPDEWDQIRPNHLLFTYFHFAASRNLSEAMLSKKATCVAYETVEAVDHTLPLLTP